MSLPADLQSLINAFDNQETNPLTRIDFLTLLRFLITNTDPKARSQALRVLCLPLAADWSSSNEPTYSYISELMGLIYLAKSQEILDFIAKREPNINISGWVCTNIIKNVDIKDIDWLMTWAQAGRHKLIILNLMRYHGWKDEWIEWFHQNIGMIEACEDRLSHIDIPQEVYHSQNPRVHDIWAHLLQYRKDISLNNGDDSINEILYCMYQHPQLIEKTPTPRNNVLFKAHRLYSQLDENQLPVGILQYLKTPQGERDFYAQFGEFEDFIALSQSKKLEKIIGLVSAPPLESAKKVKMPSPTHSVKKASAGGCGLDAADLKSITAWLAKMINFKDACHIETPKMQAKWQKDMDGLKNGMTTCFLSLPQNGSKRYISHEEAGYMIRAGILGFVMKDTKDYIKAFKSNSFGDLGKYDVLFKSYPSIEGLDFILNIFIPYHGFTKDALKCLNGTIDDDVAHNHLQKALKNADNAYGYVNDKNGEPLFLSAKLWDIENEKMREDILHQGLGVDMPQWKCYQVINGSLSLPYRYTSYKETLDEELLLHGLMALSIALSTNNQAWLDVVERNDLRDMGILTEFKQSSGHTRMRIIKEFGNPVVLAKMDKDFLLSKLRDLFGQ